MATSATKTFTISVVITNPAVGASLTSLGAVVDAANAAAAQLITNISTNQDPTIAITVNSSGWSITC